MAKLTARCRRVQTQTWRRRSCPSSRNSAVECSQSRGEHASESPSHPLSNKSDDEPKVTETVFKNGVSVKLGQVGTLPGLNYCPSLGPSMKSCCFDIKPFPEVSRPGTADLVEFASSAAGNRPGILFLCRERNIYLLISSHPGISVPTPLPPCSCCL